MTSFLAPQQLPLLEIEDEFPEAKPLPAPEVQLVANASRAVYFRALVDSALNAVDRAAGYASGSIVYGEDLRKDFDYAAEVLREARARVFEVQGGLSKLCASEVETVKKGLVK